MAKTKKNMLIATAIAVAVLVCVLAAVMFSCSGPAADADERAELDGSPSEELVTTGENQNADAEDPASEAAGEESAPDAMQESAAVDAQNASQPSGAAASQSQSAPAASTTVSTPKSTGTATQNVQSTSQAHKHDWYAVKTPQTVVDQAAWTETQYETVEKTYCSVCGEDLTHGDKEGRTPTEHGKAHALQGQGGGYKSGFVQEAVGTIEHPAVTHIEYVVTGYRCSSCGATK